MSLPSGFVIDEEPKVPEGFQLDNPAPPSGFVIDSKIQKLNHTELAALPQFQQEQPSLIDRMAGPISDVVSPIARIPQTIGDVAATIMNSPFYAARALGLIDRTKPQIRITPEGISQEQVPVMPPFGGRQPIAQIPFQPSVMQPNAPDALALANKALGMITPEVAVGAAAGVPGSAMAGYFAPQVAAQIPQEIQNTVNQWGDPVMTTREKVGATGNTLADIGMAFLLTHGMMPPEVGKSGLTRADISDPRVFNMPNKPGIPMPDVEAPKKFGTPIIGQRPLDVGQRMVTVNEPQVGGPITPAYQSMGEPKQGGQISFEGQNGIPNALQQAQPSMAQMLEEAIKRNQIEREQNARSLRSNEEPLPYDQGKERQSALQQEASGTIRSGDLQQESETGPSGNGSELRTKSEGAVNDLTRSSEGGNEPKDMALTSASKVPTTSDFFEYNKVQARMKELIANKQSGSEEFQNLWKESEGIKNKNGGMPPKEESQVVPLGERLKVRLQAFNNAQKARIESGDSMGRLDAGLFDDVVNIGKLAYGSAKDFAQWSKEMVTKLGDHVKPHLQEVWDSVRRNVETRPKDTQMLMQAGELVSQPNKLRLGLDKEGKYDAGQVVARLRNTLGENSAEWQVLKDSRLSEKFKAGEKVSPGELRKWIDENGPKVEVRKFGESGESNKSNLAIHELETRGYDLGIGDNTGRVRGVVDRRTGEQIPREKLSPELQQLVSDAEQRMGAGETSHWSSIAPKAEKDMSGYVEIAVVRGKNKVQGDKIRARIKELGGTAEQTDSGAVFRTTYPDMDIAKAKEIQRLSKELDSLERPAHPSSHSFPPNTLAFARGYMETLSNGKKVFHVVEVQSDWAQHVRELKEQQITEGGMSDKWIAHKSDPLLQHYERLALKAAIDHAKAEGADSIAISDAETAMMTEGHDRIASGGHITITHSDLASKEPRTWTIDNRENGDHIVLHSQEAADAYVQSHSIPNQASGMRLHYDRTLPKIAEELTGDKGQRVEFGEHKMATVGGLNNTTGLLSEHRDDLIFRNADNTPKTSISARQYSLDKVSNEPKTLFGKDKAQEPIKVENVKSQLEPSKGIGSGMKAAIDKNQEAGSVSLDQFRDFGEATWKAIKGLSVDFQVMKDAFKRNANFSDIIAKHGSIANGALTTATRAENHVNLEATRIFGDDSKKALNAVVAVLEAKGDKSKLAQFALQSSKDKKASEAVAFAQANWNKIQLLMKAVEGVDKFNRATAKANGIDVPYLSDYLKRMYEKEQGTFTRSRQPSGTGYSSRLKRQYETIFDAIEDGQKPVTLNAAALVGKRTNEIFNEVNQHLWTEHLKNINDSVTKEPIAQEMKVKAKGVRIAPEGHVSVDLPNGHTIAVLDGYDRLIKAVTGESHVNNSLAGRMLLQTVGGIKHGTLAFDVFHLARVAMFRKSLGLKGGYERGLAVLEFSNNDLDQAVKQGLIPQEAADYSREKVAIGGKSLSRREIVSLGIQNGLGVGKHSEALYTSFARSIPGLGDINRFIFDKFTRGAITEAFVNEAVRVSKDHPTLSLSEVAQKVSRDINFRMGNIGKQGIFKSATMQDLLRIPFLAPQWVESMGQSEARSVGQAVKAVNPMSEDFGKVGTLAKSTAGIVATFVAATQVVNMISTGHPTWQNDKGHQMDAFVPPLTKNGKGFWISPLSVAAELTHDFLRLTRKNNDPLESAGKIVSNKLSPLGHGEEMLRTGMDWKGEKHHGWDRVVSAIQESFNPTPLPVKQAIESAKAKDLAPFERQGFATIGVKAEPESYDEQKQRVINDMRKGGSMSLQDRKELEESLKSLRPTPTDSAKIASATRSMEQMFERKNAIRDELPKDMQAWMKNKGLDIESFGPSITYRKTRIGLTSQEAEEYKGIVRDAYIQFLEPWVGQDVTQARLNGVMERAKNYARRELKAKMQE